MRKSCVKRSSVVIGVCSNDFAINMLRRLLAQQGCDRFLILYSVVGFLFRKIRIKREFFRRGSLYRGGGDLVASSLTVYREREREREREKERERERERERDIERELERE